MPRKHNSNTLDGIQDSCECEPNTGCWIWMGSLDRKGYGRVRRPKTDAPELVHRVTFVLAGGIIPEGYYVDHLCRQHSCCNPAHLRAVTPRENVLGTGSLSPSAKNVLKTHCPHGHQYSGDNLYTHPNGSRQCRECSRKLDRNRYNSRIDYMKRWWEVHKGRKNADICFS